MKKCMKSFWMSAAIAVVMLVAACGDDDEKEEAKETKVSKIELTPTQLNLDPGTSQKINAVVLPDNAANRKIEWSSDDPAIAQVSQDGLVDAVSTGATKIWAKSQDGSNVSASTEVTVNDVDYAKAVVGAYEGNLKIDDYEFPMPLTLVYESTNKVSLTSELMLPVAVIDENLAPFGEQLFIMTATINVADDDGNGYFLSGSGNLALPEVIIPFVGMEGTSFEIVPGTSNSNNKMPYIDKNGVIYMRYEILGLGEVFYDGKIK